MLVEMAEFGQKRTSLKFFIPHRFANPRDTKQFFSNVMLALHRSNKTPEIIMSSNTKRSVWIRSLIAAAWLLLVISAGFAVYFLYKLLMWFSVLASMKG
jgi:hypothetical protein